MTIDLHIRVVAKLTKNAESPSSRDTAQQLQTRLRLASVLLFRINGAQLDGGTEVCRDFDETQALQELVGASGKRQKTHQKLALSLVKT